VFGAILGPAALALLHLAPPGRCWSCAAPTQGWLTLCPWCGEDIREPAPDLPEEEVRVHGPLTVIDGTAPRAPFRAADPNVATGRPSSARVIPPGNGSETSAGSPAGNPARPARNDRRIVLPPRPPLARPAPREPLAAPAATVEPAADPVQRLKARLGRSSPSLAAAEAAPAARPAAEARNVILASAIYVTGTRGLQAGSRYGIALVGDELRILGPVDFDPTAVTLVHTLKGVDATGLQGRLIITAGDGRRDRLALVFMSVAGGSAEGVADAIVTAGAEAEARRP
jgi:hypothetical protein